MKKLCLYIMLLAFSLNGFTKMLSHVFEVSTTIDTSLFYDDHLVITGKDASFPIKNGDLYINDDGTFKSSPIILEAHMSSEGVIDIDKYEGETYWSLEKIETLIDSEKKDIDLDITIDGKVFNLKDRYKDTDSSVSLLVSNHNKIDVHAEQNIATSLTVFLEPVL
ncbi:hypothetical protein IHC87_19935 [Photobacterium damselae subsp. damselae]|uniref:hypothetical protein n=1 Tax=Photobacterium damselae TaxID=38293 RepID=UPI001F24597F|nr:hypothetical protein [Photobacterium damselae]EJN6959335.1 hypothetical protein [Photobacterium damselae]EJN6961965.1 hypothetical protein [Photobacterium damselae]UJZ95710.1 hypothetical protein IHC87_19935 [Photobacterium damselae subsp. damselae]UKA00384.1 hypothetical protein IHC88_17565 [Photobacterium damselae subsp. damselae]UKA08387.1 hypothetical protein IHC90_15265 [Photobacterium damselae subsp. damselae]